MYVVLLCATFLLGAAEALYDNCAQSFLPSIVSVEQLEHANGRIMGAEVVANQFAGPPIGSGLLAIGLALPFFIDAASFAVSAALIAMIVGEGHRLKRQQRVPETPERRSFRQDIAEGVRWLWANPALRWMAVVVALLGMFSMMTMAGHVLFAQELLDTSVFEFALLGVPGALGALLGGWVSPRLRKRFGRSGCIRLVLLGAGVLSILVSASTSWIVVAALFFFVDFLNVVLNVVAVTFRQQVVPDHILGRSTARIVSP